MANLYFTVRSADGTPLDEYQFEARELNLLEIYLTVNSFYRMEITYMAIPNYVMLAESKDSKENPEMVVVTTDEDFVNMVFMAISLDYGTPDKPIELYSSFQAATTVAENLHKSKRYDVIVWDTLTMPIPDDFEEIVATIESKRKMLRHFVVLADITKLPETVRMRLETLPIGAIELIHVVPTNGTYQEWIICHLNKLLGADEVLLISAIDDMEVSSQLYIDRLSETVPMAVDRFDNPSPALMADLRY
jgi:hypothetical protein